MSDFYIFFFQFSIMVIRLCIYVELNYCNGAVELGCMWKWNVVLQLYIYFTMIYRYCRIIYYISQS